MGHDIFHADAQMTVIVDGFAVTDHQDLGGFMPDIKIFGYFIGEGAMGYQIQEIEIETLWWFRSFEPATDQLGGGATGAVFVYDLGTLR
jgi:hypothetical protein